MRDNDNDPAWEAFKIIRGRVESDSLPNMEESVKALIDLRRQARGSALIGVINNMIYAINHMKHIQQEIEVRDAHLRNAQRVESASQDGHL
jgi:hypothetical protein